MVSVRPILAGDPSRGALSLDTEANVKPGQYVQFFSNNGHEPAHESVKDTEGTLAFHRESKEACQTNPSSAFCAGSEHGYVYGRPGQASWVCSVKGSSGTVKM